MLHQTHSRKPLKSRPLPQTIEMRILQNKDQISCPYYRRRQDDDGPHKIQQNPQLANPQEWKTSMLFPWIWKLLLMLHSEILRTHPTPEQAPSERPTFYLGRCRSTSFWWNEETLYRRTCPHDAGSNMTLPDRMWCIEICIWCSPYATWHQWWSTPMCIHIMDLLSDGTELWNLWSWTPIHDLSPSRMATLYSRISTWNDNLFRPQEPHIFLKCPET